MISKYFYLYKIINKLNGKIYIGQKTSSVPPERDKCYFGGGRLIKLAIKKYGKDNFEKEIIWIADSKESMNSLEIIMIMLYKSLVPRGYNISKGGESPTEGTKHSEEHKKWLSRIQTGKKKGSNGLPLYISWDKSKDKYHVKILRKNIGYYSTLDGAVSAKESYLKNGTILKERMVRVPTSLVIERKDKDASRKRRFVVLFDRKYQKCFETRQEAERFRQNLWTRKAAELGFIAPISVMKEDIISNHESKVNG